MPIGNVCQSCGRITTHLISCPYCGSIVCANCFNKKTGSCKICKGKIQG